LTRKPDVLLFPEEGKCIIIEFKRPGTDVTDHLNQIDKYATYIRNFTKEELQIKAFYGYLIGEEIDGIDISVGAWEESYNFNYWFRPSQRVRHIDGIEHGSIYTEVIKYSTLLKRAQKRNEIFINKLNSYKSK